MTTCDVVLAMLDVVIDGNKKSAEIANKLFLKNKSIADFVHKAQTEYCIEVLNILRDAIMELKGREISND